MCADFKSERRGTENISQCSHLNARVPRTCFENILPESCTENIYERAPCYIKVPIGKVDTVLKCFRKTVFQKTVFQKTVFQLPISLESAQKLPFHRASSEKEFTKQKPNANLLVLGIWLTRK